MQLNFYGQGSQKDQKQLFFFLCICGLLDAPIESTLLLGYCWIKMDFYICFIRDGEMDCFK